jgi:hypothetical protein
MIGWVDAKMIMWADWSRRRGDGGLGYPKDSPTFRMRSTTGSMGSMVLVESDALEIEVVMSDLKRSRPELYAIGHKWYFVGAPASSIAKWVGCHRDTVYARLDALHLVIANHESRFKR